MKFYLFFLLSCLFLATSLNAQDDDISIKKDPIFKNEFSLHFQLGASNSTYGVRDNSASAHTFKNGVLLGFQVGNRWYLRWLEEHAIGIMVNWLDASMAFNRQSSTVTPPASKITKRTIDFSLLEIGPIVSHKLNKNHSIDAYYNLRPTLMISTIRKDITGARGITHAIGLGYRYHDLYFGSEFVFGKLDNVGLFLPDEGKGDYSESEMDLKNLRILFAYKF